MQKKPTTVNWFINERDSLYFSKQNYQNIFVTNVRHDIVISGLKFFISVQFLLVNQEKFMWKFINLTVFKVYSDA